MINLTDDPKDAPAILARTNLSYLSLYKYSMDHVHFDYPPTTLDTQEEVLQIQSRWKSDRIWSSNPRDLHRKLYPWSAGRPRPCALEKTTRCLIVS